MRSLDEGHLRFIAKKVEIVEKVDARAHNFDFKISIQSARSFPGVKFNNTSRNNGKPLLEANFSKNSTKTIRLLALDYYYKEISSS